MNHNLQAAWRCGVVMAFVSGVCIAFGAAFQTLAAAFLCACAWFSGWAWRGAWATYDRRLELDRQLEQARFYRAQLDALMLELQNPDPAARAAARRRLLELDPYAQVEVSHVH